MPESSWLPIRGESMCPFLVPGDLVRVEWLDEASTQAAKLEVGEIVIGKSAGEWVLHRLVSCDCPGPFRWATKGDASFSLDELDGGAIFGRARAVRRPEGSASESLAPSLLDRAIAILSFQALPSESLRARAIRPALRMLGRLKRLSLRGSRI